MNTLVKIWAVMVLAAGVVRASDFNTLVADRTAIERVYQAHRTGANEPLEQVLPAAELRRLVERDLARERALRTRYGVEIGSNEVAAEVARIEHTTRAPDVLAEIKAALGNDPERFAVSFARPIVVERELRQRFENDDDLHASIRRVCETARTNLLAAKSTGATAVALVEQLMQAHPGAVQKSIWTLTPRPSATDGDKTDNRFYFNELPAQLRQVLAVQLRAPGDVSAVIETPEGFLLFVMESKSEKLLSAACLSLAKQNCDSWLVAPPATSKNSL